MADRTTTSDALPLRHEKTLPFVDEEEGWLKQQSKAAWPLLDQNATVAETTTRDPAIDEPSLVDEKFGVR